ncbi:uncharacterized protein STEHIDRAFT_122114, partial [Stereum hirsutum FP-91666 SS1]|uniref:uncharacterized protein n=1 Tax=Stereum hirsutum (strain FP-91666) TaxID=721885 RepID=UPI000444A128
NPIMCPARTTDGRDVMIRLVCISGDPSPSGARHLSILRQIAKGHVACIGNNHIVPVLQELTDTERGLTFVVQPKLYWLDTLPNWYSAREAADFVVQIFEGLEFCHKRLIAHLDIGYDNLLVNFRGGPQYPPPTNTSSETWPFRSHFPIRYYLNDFEIGLSFDENSDPSSRTTTGFPHTVSGRKGPYGRAPAPEMLKQDVPHCPFRLDVWQVGIMMKEKARFEDIGGLPEYQGLFDEMMAEDPLARPTMSEALRRARELRLTLPQVI